MAVDVKKLIAAISPDIYCSNIRGKDGEIPRVEVKKIAKKDGYLKAAEKAELIESDYLDITHIGFAKSVFDLEGLKRPIEKHVLAYDASAQNLEPIYFWILDFVNASFGSSEKLTDNFASSAGSGHFAEMQTRATRMQEEGMKILVAANNVLRSVLNLIYDLKEWKLKLAPYDELKSEDEKKKESAILSLKQTWMDAVDIKRQTTSLKGLAQQMDYVTIIDAFMVAPVLSKDSLKKVGEIDLNDRVKRILLQRVAEFEKWTKESEEQLRKRFEIEKKYLKSQVSSLKLYSRWAKPYLRAAKQLEQNLEHTSDLVTMFNTAIFELVIMGKGKYDPDKDVANGNLPVVFSKVKTRKYTPITIVEFRFRSIPDRAQQQGAYNFRGKVNIQFTSFALNEDELSVLKKEIEKDDLGDIFEMVEGATEGSLGTVKEDIDEFLGEKKEEKKAEEDSNPFSALFSFFKREEKSDVKKDFSKGIPPDNYYEKVFRSQAILSARASCRRLYDAYKKTNEMPAFPPSINM